MKRTEVQELQEFRSCRMERITPLGALRCPSLFRENFCVTGHFEDQNTDAAKKQISQDSGLRMSEVERTELS
jgi:hypothetical protein